MGEKGVYTLAFSPNGRKLAIAGADKNVTVVDVKVSKLPLRPPFLSLRCALTAALLQ